MDYSEAVKVLRDIPLFAKIDPAKLKLVAFASEYMRFEAGESLFQEGDPADSIFLIHEGEAAVIGHAKGEEVEVASLGKNALFGEMALFLRSPRTAEVRAKGPLGVLRIDGSMFLRLITEAPETALDVMRILSEKLARATSSFQDAATRLRVLDKPDNGPAR